ncbi:Protein ENHANCED DISEASE RESISTANCE 4 [Linum perenne]
MRDPTVMAAAKFLVSSLFLALLLSAVWADSSTDIEGDVGEPAIQVTESKYLQSSFKSLNHKLSFLAFYEFNIVNLCNFLLRTSVSDAVDISPHSLLLVFPCGIRVLILTKLQVIMADGSKARLVRCPKCRNLLTELPDFSVYQCGGCGAVLRESRIDRKTNGGGDDGGGGEEARGEAE